MCGKMYNKNELNVSHEICTSVLRCSCVVFHVSLSLPVSLSKINVKLTINLFLTVSLET